MHIKHGTGLLLAVVCALAYGQAQELVQEQAQDQAQDQAQERTQERTQNQAAAAAAGSSALPPPQSVNGITYVCGGVGSDEATRMKQAAREYDLMLTFATRSGSFLSDVKVDIADARGRPLLSAVCEGPIMLVDLPREGRYRVRGELAGDAVSATTLLRRGDKGKPLHLALPGDEDSSG